MKIAQDLQSQTIKQLRPNITSKQSFETIVQSKAQHMNQQVLEGLIRDISVQGDKLQRFHSFQDLAKFKRMVKGFLEETVYNGLDLKKSQNFSPDGRSQQLAIVREVDQKLIELTEEVINQEKNAVDLLGIIGEIKGLLVNLYT